MKKSFINQYLFFFMAVATVSISCKKYLNAKPDGAFDTLNTIEECQAVLDNAILYTSLTGAAEIGADTYFIDQAGFGSLSAYEQQIYLWQKTADKPSEGSWDSQYRAIGYANVVLDELLKIDRTPDQQNAYNNVKGTALFYRSFYFFALSQVYTKPYSAHTAGTDLGLPLRLDAGFIKRSVRATLLQTYDQIINDFKLSATMLPDAPIVKTRPGKSAVYAALARTYLAMREYDSAGVYADRCLKMGVSLIDFNDINYSANSPFPTFENNKEVIFACYSGSNPTVLRPAFAKIQPALYNLYHQDDLRLKAYFRANTGASAGSFAFKGEWRGTSFNGGTFGGLLSDEVYLIRAECRARSGDLSGAMSDVNALLKKRWNKSAVFREYTATTIEEAVKLILTERRKELLYRGTMWSDMRRMSLEPTYALSFSRSINGQLYRLLPNGSGYIHQIPQVIIELSGMEQNP